ncbi:MAG TPA: toll/interleukin-1 receptor domain-containing protein, partial [Thermoanaerobaculia bacterium]|nr:toll/interleukin-1 receptor domain-containing protein [Thermoanaerobaculia bacterium]
MSRIFLSHSSANNAEAIALRDWLISLGWDELFLDLDPERGLKAGERWQAALKQAAERCELVIFLVSPVWAASKWCLAEFLLASNLNKRIFGVMVEPTPFAELPSELTAEWQLVDLTAGERDFAVTVTLPPGDKTATVKLSSDGLNRLRIGLMQSGLDPKHFAWPPEHDADRSPYRGLQPLEAEDAGIFFGRDGPTVIGLDMLR